MHILLVDDEPMLLDSMARAVRLERPDWALSTARDGREAMAALRGGPVDLLVTDIRMPGMDGMALLAEVRRDPGLARLPLIFISALDDRATIRLGMTSGADDFLTKPFTCEELVHAVEARMGRQPTGPEASGLRARLAGLLTERELEVLALVGQGLVTKEIAERLGLSPRTVSGHRDGLMRKLGLHNAAALAALAIRANLG